MDESKDKQGVQVKDDGGANGNAEPAGPEGSSASGKGKSTRARRLSYVKGNANGVAMVSSESPLAMPRWNIDAALREIDADRIFFTCMQNEGGEEAPPPNAVNQQDAATKAKNTRGRRLSYVTNDVSSRSFASMRCCFVCVLCCPLTNLAFAS